ncbi:MAG: AAA family ATPase [Magnetococcales bacterium]|nr:AAA family ATPase [Magnetococcales bacterium]
MSTFDTIVSSAIEVLEEHRNVVAELEWLLINRDLNGRVRFIVSEKNAANDTRYKQIEDLYSALAQRIAPHAYPVATGILSEKEHENACQGAASFKLPGFKNVRVIDRLASESRWETIAEVSPGVPRIVFFSIKGGVGRSTALAACTWALARQGKRVLVLDLDLESPGLSSSLLSPERQPKYGITDWLVEDLVDNGNEVKNDLIAMSDLPTDGQIIFVPAHGKDPGDYVSKLGRVWMPKTTLRKPPEAWSERLNRLLNQLETDIKPDVILIDSRAGIDEVAATCVTHLGADTILMFAIQGQQTWTGYRTLFSYWQQLGAITKMRIRLQLVAGLVPDDERRPEYIAAICTSSYLLFADIYDNVSLGAVSGWNYEEDDDTAPHAPLPIRWNRGWFGLLNLQQRMQQLDEDEVELVYGKLLGFLKNVLERENQT